MTNDQPTRTRPLAEPGDSGRRARQARRPPRVELHGLCDGAPLPRGRADGHGPATGHSGFTVELDDHTYVVAYLDRDRLCWKHGPGVPTAADFRLIASSQYGDAGEPLTMDRPYATESCDIAAEVARAHGQRIETLSIGENTFNLAFGDGHELDTMLVTAKDGRRGLRVFWEQW